MTILRMFLLLMRRICVDNGVHISAGKIGGYIDFQTIISFAQLAPESQSSKMYHRICWFNAVHMNNQWKDERKGKELY